MVNSNNLVLLRGHLGADPETRNTPTGARVVDFRMATNTYWTAGDGQRRERTDWHRVSTFGRTADFCASYLRKGDLVQVLGSIRNDVVGDGPTRKTFSSVKAHEVTGLNKTTGAARGEAAAEPPAFAAPGSQLQGCAESASTEWSAQQGGSGVYPDPPIRQFGAPVHAPAAAADLSADEMPF